MESWEPFSESRRKELLRELTTPPRSLAELRAARRHLSGLDQTLATWQTLLDRDAAFAVTSFERILPSIFVHARGLLRDSAPRLAVHQIGVAARTVLARGEVAGWLAHLLLGTLTPPSRLHPSLELTLLDGAEPSQQAKLRCILAYFQRIGDAAPLGQLVIERRVVAPRTAREWVNDDSPLTELVVDDRGTIEDAVGHIETDFANCFLGGGVLRRGAVQEEIRLAIAPETLVGLIVSPVMRDDEAIVIRGSERFARTRGYAGTLEFAGLFDDPVQRDEAGTPDSTLVAIDAVDYGRGGDRTAQFTAPAILRELNKARAGWQRDARAQPVASGNWGCGVFGGDPPLKALLQWAAAASEGRALRYCAFGDVRVGALQACATRLLASGLTVGELVRRVLAEATPAGGSELYTRVLRPS